MGQDLLLTEGAMSRIAPWLESQLPETPFLARRYLENVASNDYQGRSFIWARVARSLSAVKASVCFAAFVTKVWVGLSFRTALKMVFLNRSLSWQKLGEEWQGAIRLSAINGYLAISAVAIVIVGSAAKSLMDPGKTKDVQKREHYESCLEDAKKVYALFQTIGKQSRKSREDFCKTAIGRHFPSLFWDAFNEPELSPLKYETHYEAVVKRCLRLQRNISELFSKPEVVQEMCHILGYDEYRFDLKDALKELVLRRNKDEPLIFSFRDLAKIKPFLRFLIYSRLDRKYTLDFCGATITQEEEELILCLLQSGRVEALTLYGSHCEEEKSFLQKVHDLKKEQQSHGRRSNLSLSYSISHGSYLEESRASVTFIPVATRLTLDVDMQTDPEPCDISSEKERVLKVGVEKDVQTEALPILITAETAQLFLSKCTDLLLFQLADYLSDPKQGQGLIKRFIVHVDMEAISLQAFDAVLKTLLCVKSSLKELHFIGELHLLECPSAYALDDRLQIWLTAARQTSIQQLTLPHVQGMDYVAMCFARMQLVRRAAQAIVQAPHLQSRQEALWRGVEGYYAHAGEVINGGYHASDVPRVVDLKDAGLLPGAVLDLLLDLVEKGVVTEMDLRGVKIETHRENFWKNLGDVLWKGAYHFRVLRVGTDIMSVPLLGFLEAMQKQPTLRHVDLTRAPLSFEPEQKQQLESYRKDRSAKLCQLLQKEPLDPVVDLTGERIDEEVAQALQLALAKGDIEKLIVRCVVIDKFSKKLGDIADFLEGIMKEGLTLQLEKDLFHPPIIQRLQTSASKKKAILQLI